jgi:hypothetical protein
MLIAFTEENRCWIRNLLSQLLFVIGNAATLIADACLKGELCSWLDRARFWHLVLQNGYLSLWDSAAALTRLNISRAAIMPELLQ